MTQDLAKPAVRMTGISRGSIWLGIFYSSTSSNRRKPQKTSRQDR